MLKYKNLATRRRGSRLLVVWLCGIVSLFFVHSPAFALDYDIRNDAQSFLFIKSSSGNVGIGSTEPRARLEVDGVLYSTGNLGIGTAVPQARLEVDNAAVFHRFVPNTCNGTATINWGSGNKQTLTLNGNCTTLNFTPPAGGVANFVLKIINTASYTISWPSVKWPDGFAPTLTSSGMDIVTFIYDGTDYFGSASFNFQ